MTPHAAYRWPPQRFLLTVNDFSQLNFQILSIKCQRGSISTHITSSRIDPSFLALLFHTPLSSPYNLPSPKISPSPNSALNLDIMTQPFQSRDRVWMDAIFEMNDGIMSCRFVRRDGDSRSVESDLWRVTKS